MPSLMRVRVVIYVHCNTRVVQERVVEDVGDNLGRAWNEAKRLWTDSAKNRGTNRRKQPGKAGARRRGGSKSRATAPVQQSRGDGDWEGAHP